MLKRQGKRMRTKKQRGKKSNQNLRLETQRETNFFFLLHLERLQVGLHTGLPKFIFKILFNY